MYVKEKILLSREGLTKHGPINIVIFGDSVSHGALNGTIDFENVYWNRLKKMLNAYRSYVPVNMICASIGGTTAAASLERMDRQVLQHDPDLVIVCFGLNDINGPLEVYLDSLEQIFRKCLEGGCDTIFMTPNMLNTYVAQDTPQEYLTYAAKTAEIQNSGKMDQYIFAAAALAERMGISVCDCYSKWKKLSETEDTTKMLINRINHPTSEMHKLFAESLYDTIMGSGQACQESDSTMYRST